MFLNVLSSDGVLLIDNSQCFESSLSKSEFYPCIKTLAPGAFLSIFSRPQMTESRGKKRTFIACLPCQKAHLSCDSERPCSCCISRGIPSECVDGNRRKTKYLENIPSFLLSQQNSNSQQFYLQKTGFSRLLALLKTRTWEGHIETKVLISDALVRLMNILRLFSSEQISMLESSVSLAVEEFSKMACIMPVPTLICHLSGKVLFVSPECASMLSLGQLEVDQNIFEHLDDISILKFWRTLNDILTESGSGNGEDSWRKYSLQLTFQRIYESNVNVSVWISVRKDSFQFPSSIVCTFLPGLNGESNYQ
jgi:hypothetical protein